jgi:hypothetical protein
MLRRYGEQALKDDIASLLQLWSGHIQCCSVLLIAAPRTLQHCLFDVSMSKGGGAVLSKEDPRISSVPFAVNRPTLDEVRAVHERCTRVLYSRAPSDDGMETVTRSAAVESICIPNPIQESCEMTSGDKELSNHPNNHDLVVVPAGSPIPEFVMHPAARELIQACLAGNESLVISLVAALERGSVPSFDTSTAPSDDPLDIESDLDPNSTGSNSSNSSYQQQIIDAVDSLEQMRTALHICSEAGMHSAVFSLLLVGGASPLRVDVRGRTPYFVAKNKGEYYLPVLPYSFYLSILSTYLSYETRP